MGMGYFPVFGLLMGLIGLGVSFCITFLPSILAMLRGNVYRGQVIKYQLLHLAANIAVSMVTGVIAFLSMNMGLELGFIMIIVTIGTVIWILTSIVLWFYILINAIQDTQMTLFSRFGINL